MRPGDSASADTRDADVDAFVERTTRASGVPMLIEDPVSIEHVVALLRGDDD